MVQTGFVDDVAVPEVFVSDLAYMEAVGPCVRFTLYTERGGEKHLTLSVIMPMEVVPGAVGRVVEFIAAQSWAKIRRGTATLIMPPVKVQ